METPYLDSLKQGANEVFIRENRELPEDFDKAKFKRGQEFFKNNIFSCTTAMAVSLILGLTIRKFMTLLQATWKPRDSEEAYSRYFKTYLHLAAWHYDDVWDPASKAWHSLQTVRQMHGRRHELMRRKVGTETLYFTQSDMVLALSGFVGGILLYGQRLGIVATDDDYDDYVYFWRWIGYLFGIADKYNLCCHGYRVALRNCKEIQQGVLIPSMLDPPDNYYRFGRDVVAGGKFLGLIVNLEAITGWSFKTVGVEGPPLSIGNRIRIAVFQFQFLVLKYVPIVRTLLNKLVERSLL